MTCACVATCDGHGKIQKENMNIKNELEWLNGYVDHLQDKREKAEVLDFWEKAEELTLEIELTIHKIHVLSGTVDK